MPEAPTVRVTLPLPMFKALLQRGVGVPFGAGVSVREFLQEALGIDADYVEENLQTVFLDGQPIDDFDRAVVRPSAVLALSGAMPGLVGATMRRGGYYARMREGITHPEKEEVGGGGADSFVVVKLFNRPLADLHETLLGRPLLAPADALADVLADALADAPADALDPEAAEDHWVRLVVTLA